MRRHEESRDSEFERMVKLGEDNLECLRQMSSWCSHAEMELQSAGLYAQMTGLPIATYSIGCQHVQGGSQAMNLRWIFTEFLVKNCAGCPHHTPTGDASWGQAIIDKNGLDVQKREQAAKEEADRVFRLRSEMRSASRRVSADAPPESHRILDFLEAIFSEVETEQDAASERLQQAARLAPDLFSDAAIDLLLVLAATDAFAERILPVCAEIASRRSDLCSRIDQMAIVNIENGLHPELSASILDRPNDPIAYPLSNAAIEKLLLSQNHYRPIGGWKHDQPDYSHSTAVIVRCFDANPESVQSIIRRELKNGDDVVRVQLSGAVKNIQKDRPQLALNLLQDLLQSLERYEDDHFGETPSGQIIHVLQSAFRHSAKEVDHFLAQSMTRVRETVQEDIVRIYRDQFFDRSLSWNERREHRDRREITEQEKLAIHRLFEWAKDSQFDIDIRVSTLESLEIACKYATEGVLSHFDSLLGYTAIVNGEPHPPPAPPKILLPGETQDPQLEQLKQFSRNQQWGFFKQRLQKCLEELCEARPSEVFDSVYRCLSEPSAYLEDGFKACCISLLGELGKDYLLRPRVLPLIMRALMDYSSAWVRAKAIEASIEMFSYSNASPPANLVDTIIVHLQDPKVVVHQAALRAVSRRSSWFDERQSIEVLNCLQSHLNAYRDDKFQLDDICDGILTVCPAIEGYKLIALRMVESILPTGEELVDSKIANNLMRFCDASERIAQYVAKDIASYLARHDRDHHNYYGHSNRGRMFEWLHELPLEIYQRAVEDILASATELAKRDAWESSHFASLFAHLRDFRNEQVVWETAANSLPEEPRCESFRAELRQFANIASTNVSLQSAKPEVVNL